MAKICSPNKKFKKHFVIKTKPKKNSKADGCREIIDVIEQNVESIPGNSISVQQKLPIFQGAMDTFIAPNIFRGWVFFQEGHNLRIRIVAGSTVLGEADADKIRPDLIHLNNGLTGWLLESQCQLSEKEFFSLAETIQVLVLDDAGQVIGCIPIWSKLLEKLAAG